jgi:hypothetical protein
MNPSSKQGATPAGRISTALWMLIHQEIFTGKDRE